MHLCPKKLPSWILLKLHKEIFVWGPRRIDVVTKWSKDYSRSEQLAHLSCHPLCADDDDVDVDHDDDDDSAVDDDNIREDEQLTYLGRHPLYDDSAPPSCTFSYTSGPSFDPREFQTSRDLSLASLLPTNLLPSLPIV